MKKIKTGRTAAVLTMLLLIVLSVPVGMHTSMAHNDNAAMRAFYKASSGSSAREILTADEQLGKNLVRSAKVIVSDFSDSTEAGELLSAQQALEGTYSEFSLQAGKSSEGRGHTDKLVESYNAFSSAMFHWLKVADGVMKGSEEKYATYMTFRNKFVQNHVLLEDGEYNRAAAVYNELFERPLVRVLQPVSFTSPLLLFDAEDF